MISTLNQISLKQSALWLKAASRSLARPLWQQRLAHSSAPILVGPWRGEVGIEALYWVPWLAQLRHTLGIDPTRMIPIGRSGSASWYGVPTGIELFHLRTPEQVRIESRMQQVKTGLLKQVKWTAFERDVVRDAAKAIGAKRYHTLHPGRMFADLRPFLDTAAGLGWAMTKLRFAPITVANLDGLAQLPEHFVAAHFYTRFTWPASPVTKQFSLETIKQIARNQPVMLMGNGLHMDDHADMAMPNLDNVYRITDIGLPITPETTLHWQTAVLARADGFVGTYGGFTHLAALLRKPSISLYTEFKGIGVCHKHLTEALATQLGVPCHILKLQDLALLQHALPQITVTAGPTVADDVPAMPLAEMGRNA